MGKSLKQNAGDDTLILQDVKTLTYHMVGKSCFGLLLPLNKFIVAISISWHASPYRNVGDIALFLQDVNTLTYQMELVWMTGGRQIVNSQELQLPLNAGFVLVSHI